MFCYLDSVVDIFGRLKKLPPPQSLPQSLEPVNAAFFGKRVFVDVINLILFRWGGLPWIIQVSPKCNHMYPFKREAGEGSTNRGDSVNMEQRDV